MSDQLADASRRKRFILSKEFHDALKGLGVVPDNCRRIVIDVPTNSAVVIHFECYGDARLLEVLSIPGAVVICEEERTCEKSQLEPGEPIGSADRN